ncbi:MAG: nucleotidyltransferase domain-containing protein [Oscillospiraceae bacterium]|nr:nucleotidyltransferase domain-containing protein [Oscillospiraceae bacterium]
MDEIMEAVALRARQSLGGRLRKVILFGSFAREDYDAQSDVDIMVLTENSDLKRDQARMDAIADAISLASDRTISIMLKDRAEFESRLYVPFYRNVAEEGRVLYAA